MSAATAAPTPLRAARLDSIDALRGLVMIVMALDHTRDFLHSGAMTFQPEDLTRTTALLFLTRWITHFCAPVFMFTAGIGAYLRLERRGDLGEVSRYLGSRGLWLIFLELTVFHWILNFNFDYSLTILLVLWALGWSMIVLAGAIRLPWKALLAVSLLVILLHNATDGLNAAALGGWAWVWNFLHQPGGVRVGGILLIFGYPLLPWAAVMSAGFCFGLVLSFDESRRRAWMFRLGLGMTTAFVVLRAINVYGDPQPWSTAIPGMTVLSFLRCTKYPPSLLFLLMTLGPALMMLAWLDGRRLAKWNPLIVFGRTPLFYFLLHFFLAHLILVALSWLTWQRTDILLKPPPSVGGNAADFPAGFGWDLWVTYACWLAVVLISYPLCLWFARLRERRRDWWLGYL